MKPMFSDQSIFLKLDVPDNNLLQFSIDQVKQLDRFLNSDSHLPKTIVLFASLPFKNDEKYFLFHLKSSFCSEDI